MLPQTLPRETAHALRLEGLDPELAVAPVADVARRGGALRRALAKTLALIRARSRAREPRKLA